MRLIDDKRMIELQAQNNEDILRDQFKRELVVHLGNVGMVLGERSIYYSMEDNLALELEKNIWLSTISGSHSDGYKSSISGPGVGNYITVAKCVADAEKILGTKQLRNQTLFMRMAAPANRTTESHILNEVAKTYGISSWPVTGIKSFLGHSMAPASGDQLVTALGTWNKGIIPRIRSTDNIAEDVYDDNLNILLEDKIEDKNHFSAAFLNAKGFWK